MKPMSTSEHYHILGIAGHAMSGVAVALQRLGHTVTGTDPGAYPPATDFLDGHGIQWWREADAAHLDGVTVVVLGGGVPLDHPELLAAQQQGLSIRSYPEVVGELVAGARRIAVTGTHGKTTTTSLIAWLLESAGRQPDYVIGIKPHNFESSVRLAGSDIAVLEGDEYRSSLLDLSPKFLHYHPDVVIITSIEHDHPDMYPDLASVQESFRSLVRGLPSDGRLLICEGSEGVTEVAVEANAPISTYGPHGHWSPVQVEYRPDGVAFDLMRHGKLVGRIEVALYGEHNVLNATAAAAVVLQEDVSLEQLQAGMRSFAGAARRFERVSAAGAAITVVDDYAHHPTEVVATIAAAKAHFHGRVIAVFMPHTYSRTAALLDEYRAAFRDADQAYILPIEGAREADIATTVSGADMVAGDRMAYAPDREELLGKITADARPGDVVLCMTVSGYDRFAQELAARLAG
jgi:UDP-N-acetylmuramate--L-alanine ligase